MHHLDKLLEHLLSHREVGYHAVFHRANSFDIARHFAQHGLGFVTHRLDGFLALGAAFMANRHHGWLIENDTAVTNINQGIGGT